ncbi:LOW QUALITY PROTEIN: ubinuclein-1-like [Gymnodraco acuticeps]|uniref:LOW QUALITY PROTEIN: ubinuclein-1-like n=1 Tax=Gymnodraco acuticeps TaxID=8218 RepID=A0A6P8W6M2_GYMAC|nr:LOW QUALITY PROTEIN: ubinuclein-1-like [Gymnodraco acuticeps]
MAESRRVQLTTLSCEAPLPTQPALVEVKHPPGVVQEEEKCLDRPSEPSSTRLVLKLFDPDERSFPEFSYTRLLDNKINNTKVPLRRFDEEEKREIDEVVALSGELEKKYADKPKNKDRIQDLIDIGYGYDDEDSFIDNTEPYDEFVPASLTTKFGGFYINSGVLHFRHTSETEDLKAREKTPESSKKRKVNDGQDKPKKKKKRCREEAEQTISFLDPKSSPFTELASDDKIKKKKVSHTLSVTSMLKKFQREKGKMDKVKPRRSAITMFPADAGGGGGLGLTDPLLSLIGSTNEHTLIQAVNAMDFHIDSLLDVSEAASSTKMAPPPSTETQLFSPKTEMTQSEARPQVLPPINVQLQLEQIQIPTHTSSTLPQCVPLPEGLPPRLEDSIRKLTVVAKTSEGESKLKFFTPEINSMLLDIELQCREQGVQLRSKVFTHLSSFLPCSRDTLLKRVKKLFLAHTEEYSDVENRMEKLKEAVCRAMPEQIASFNESCQVYEQARTSKAAEEKESKQKENVGPEDNMEEKGGKRGSPKKLFKWNEEIRECLCHVLTVNMERYKRQKRSQELEDYLKTFLDHEVKLLWPKGWMQSRVLIKESREMLSLFAPLPVKRVRPEKKQSPLISPLATSDNFSVLQESPLLSRPPHDSDDVIIVSSNPSNPVSLSSENKETLLKVEGQTRRISVDSASSRPADKLPINARYAQTQSLVELLAEQALARVQPIPQEFLAAAVAKYKRSVQHLILGSDTRSPPVPPPPPHSSPVGFPLCRVVVPQQVRDVRRLSDAGHVLIISDDDDVMLQ